MKTDLALSLGGIIAICAITFAVGADSDKQPAIKTTLSPAAQKEIAAVEAEIDAIEAATLAQVEQGSLDRSQQILLLGKLIFYDRELSVARNVACAFCHMPETGFTGPVSELNQTTVAYPGSIRTRFSGRKPQTHTYASFAPVLHYNAQQGDLVGGAFWDMRATGLRLNSPLAEQAQGPPLNPIEIGLIDSACVVYRMVDRPYRSMAERLWGAQAFAIRWPRDMKAVCDRPDPALDSVRLTPMDRGLVETTFDRVAQTLAAYEGSAEVNPFSSKYDYVMTGKSQFNA